jgi:hypothetical protein
MGVMMPSKTGTRQFHWALPEHDQEKACPALDAGCAAVFLSRQTRNAFARKSCSIKNLEHDPEKCVAVFPRDKRGTRLRGDHAQTNPERDGDST